MTHDEYIISGALRRVVVVKHFGPGPHPGTGTDQTVHGGDGGTQTPHGSRETVYDLTKPEANEALQSARRAIRSHRMFAEWLLTGPGNRTGVLYTDREDYIVDRMQQTADNRYEVAWAVDSRGHITLRGSAEIDPEQIEVQGDATSITLDPECFAKIRVSEADGMDPVFIHNHPRVAGTTVSSPPSDKDLSLAFNDHVLDQRMAAWDGYYEVAFLRMPDKTDREVWNQNADIWIEDNPRSPGLDAFRERMRHDSSLEPPPGILDEVYRRQHATLEYIASQMPDLFDYRFRPWPTES